MRVALVLCIRKNNQLNFMPSWISLARLQPKPPYKWAKRQRLNISNFYFAITTTTIYEQ